MANEVTTKQKFFAGITRNVVMLGFVSLLTDMASEMLYPVIPLFVVGVLGATPQLLGTIEGVAEGISTALRWIGGVLSDVSRKRKPFVVAGYSLSALSKPIMGLAAFVGGWPVFLLGRSSDRLGKSLRTAARDALIADATEPQYRGLAFGIHRAMDTTGAIIGPLSAMAILMFLPASPTFLPYLFVLALIPGLASTALALWGVRDIPHQAHPEEARKRLAFAQAFPAPFLILLAANALFSLGNSSDAFLILRSTEIAYPTATSLTDKAIFACGLYAVFNLIYALMATPFGKLSDRLGRKPVVITGWLVYAAVYLGFAVLHAPWTPWLLFAFYGLYQAFSEGVTKAMVADLVPAQQRAGAIGLFYTVSGLGQLAASWLAGQVWYIQVFHGQVMLAFFLGTIFALAAVPVITLVRMPENKLEGALQ